VCAEEAAAAAVTVAAPVVPQLQITQSICDAMKDENCANLPDEFVGEFDCNMFNCPLFNDQQYAEAKDAFMSYVEYGTSWGDRRLRWRRSSTESMLNAFCELKDVPECAFMTEEDEGGEGTEDDDDMFDPAKCQDGRRIRGRRVTDSTKSITATVELASSVPDGVINYVASQGLSFEASIGGTTTTVTGAVEAGDGVDTNIPAVSGSGAVVSGSGNDIVSLAPGTSAPGTSGAVAAAVSVAVFATAVVAAFAL
jgi:hypothetical protein